MLSAGFGSDSLSARNAGSALTDSNLRDESLPRRKRLSNRTRGLINDRARTSAAARPSPPDARGAQLYLWSVSFSRSMRVDSCRRRTCEPAPGTGTDRRCLMTVSPETTPGAVKRAPEPPPLLIERVLGRGRLSVAFRLLLALPQFIVLYVLSLVGSLVLVVGWVAALILGRLPEPIARFLGHVIGYSARVSAYTLLLTDRYPPSSFQLRTIPSGSSWRPVGSTAWRCYSDPHGRWPPRRMRIGHARPSSAFLGAREPVIQTDAGTFPAPRTVCCEHDFQHR